ncbi:MAG: hypothetical protein ACI4JY_07820 [Oscillospiraceae bacterium]
MEMYIDRSDFISDIYKYIQETNTPSIILVAAFSGVGKYSAVRKLIQEKIGNEYNIVTLPPSMVNEDTYKVKYSYFFKVIERIQNEYIYFNSKKSNLSFTKFVKKHGIYKEQLAEEISSSISEDSFSIKGGLALFVKWIFSRIFNVCSFDLVKLLNNETANSVAIGKRYINHILCNDRVILELCAAQYIDPESLSALCSSIKAESKSGKGIIILEYDIDNEQYLNYEDFCTNLNTLCGHHPPYIRKLDALEFNDFFTVLCSKRSWDLSSYQTWLKNEYNKSDTKSILEFEEKISAIISSHGTSLCSLSIKPLNEFLHCASKDELCILSIVDIHNGCIKKKDIYNFWDANIRVGKIDANINNLISLNILKENDEYIEFYHPLIQKKWEEYILNNSLSDSVILAANKCFDYYYSRVSKADIINDTLEFKKSIRLLLRIITHYFPMRIMYMSKYLELIVKEFTRPEHAKNLIKLLVEELRKNKEESIDYYYQVINLCCDLELYSDALNYWNDIQNIVVKPETHKCDNANFLFCKVHYLCDMHNEVIRFAKEKLECSIPPESVIYYSIYMIISLRASNQYDKIESVVSAIADNAEKYSNCIEYGLFLRISEVYKSRIKAIPDVEESVSFFLEHNRIDQAAKSQVSLSFLYAITNDLNKAQKSLQSAKSYYKDQYQHILCNNEATIKILSQKFDPSVENLLNKAVMCSNGIFSNLAIYNNQMIYYYETNQLPELLARISLVEKELDKLVDKHLFAIICYNLSVFLKGTDPEKSNNYYVNAYDYREHCSSLNTRLSGREPKDECEAFLVKLPWHVTMLSFWETDFI